MGDIGGFSKDMRARKRQAKKANPPHCCCHYAKNYSGFTTYPRIGRQMGWSLTSVYVAGIGTVQLQVRASSVRGAPTRTLELHNVLHTPGTLCNGFSSIKWQREGGKGGIDRFLQRDG